MDKHMTEHEETGDGLQAQPIGETASEKKPTPSERHAAFAVLYRVVTALMHRGRTRAFLKSAEFQQVIAQTEEALHAVARAILRRTSGLYVHRCDLCCRHSSEHVANVRENERSTWGCTLCSRGLQAEGSLKKEGFYVGQQ